MTRRAAFIFYLAASLLFTGSCFAKTTPQPTPSALPRPSTRTVLIVPGHDDEFSGAVYKNITEASMTLALAQALAKELSKDNTISVTISRDEKGYIPDIQSFFTDNDPTIDTFIQSSKDAFRAYLKEMNITLPDHVTHANAPVSVAHHLYELNKYADEQSFDTVIHIHFNDYGSHQADTPGDYTGYGVYVPGKELLGYEESQKLGAAIAKNLHRIAYPTDTPRRKSESNQAGHYS